MTTTTASRIAPNRIAHYALWMLQVLLAFVFLGAGATKLFQPIDVLAQQMSYVTYTPEMIVRFAGAMEILGALGLLLPSATRVLPWLTPMAAAGLATIMVLAAGTHLSHGEVQMLPVNLVLGTLAATIAWGRFRVSPIQ